MAGCWFVFEPMGLALSSLAWAFLAFADYVVVFVVIMSWFSSKTPRFAALPISDGGLVVFGLYQFLIFLTWFSHLQAATTDPGTITVNDAPEDFKNPKFCQTCETHTQQRSWKPPRAHHCKVCNRCIFRMDHHCPWVNNCVGLSNQKLFILFLIYTCASSVTTLLLLLISVIAWFLTQSSFAEAETPPAFALICGGMLIVECIAALMFVSDFLTEQIESITTNSTLVETYQRTRGAKMTFQEHLNIIFGDNKWLWPIPIPSHRTPDYLERAIPENAGDEIEEIAPDDADSLGIGGRESTTSSIPAGSRVQKRPGGRWQTKDE